MCDTVAGLSYDTHIPVADFGQQRISALHARPDGVARAVDGPSAPEPYWHRDEDFGRNQRSPIDPVGFNCRA